jgi:hypothetical protein
LEDRGVDGSIRSNGTEGDWLGVWGGSSWLRIGTGGGFCKYGDEPSGSGATDSVIIAFDIR